MLLLHNIIGFCFTGFMVGLMLLLEGTNLSDPLSRTGNFGASASLLLSSVSSGDMAPQVRAASSVVSRLRGSLLLSTAAAAAAEEPAPREKLHLIEGCGQCPGIDLCVAESSNQPQSRMMADFTVGKPLAQWGCQHMEAKPRIARSAQTGETFVIEPAGAGTAPALDSVNASSYPAERHLVTSCSECGGKDLCTGWQRDDPAVEADYAEGLMLKLWGCQNLGESPRLVRNSETGAIYVVESPEEVAKRLSSPRYVLLL